LQEFLLNFSRPFIYTTALPLASLVAIRKAYELLPALTQERKQVQQLANFYAALASGEGVSGLFSGKQARNASPIQAWLLPDPAALRQLAGLLQAQGLDVRPVFSPTVPVGQERLRLVLHAFNTQDQVQRLWNTLTQNTPKNTLSPESARR